MSFCFLYVTGQLRVIMFFFFKQKTAYEMRISDWSSDVCSSDLNPDLIELLRASYAVVAGARSEVEHLLSLPSGYHRDLQFSKGTLLRAFAHGLDALALLPGLLQGWQWDTQRMSDALDQDMDAPHRVYALAHPGGRFRRAYTQDP